MLTLRVGGRMQVQYKACHIRTFQWTLHTSWCCLEFQREENNRRKLESGLRNEGRNKEITILSWVACGNTQLLRYIGELKTTESRWWGKWREKGWHCIWARCGSKSVDIFKHSSRCVCGWKGEGESKDVDTLMVWMLKNIPLEHVAARV